LSGVYPATRVFRAETLTCSPDVDRPVQAVIEGRGDNQ
jgi:hypothetical protein